MSQKTNADNFIENCIFRINPATDSNARRPPIPYDLTFLLTFVKLYMMRRFISCQLNSG